MKRLFSLPVLTGIMFMVAAGACLHAATVGEPKGKGTKVEEVASVLKVIKAHRIVLVDEDGKEGVVIHASKTANGIWVNDPGSKAVATMYGVKGQGACIGLYGNVEKDKAMPFAVATNSSAKNGPYFQLVGKDGEPKFLDAIKLIPRPQD